MNSIDLQHDNRVMKGERSANLFPKPVHDEPPAVQRKKLHTMMKQDLEKKNKLSTYNNDMDSLRYAALCRGEDFRVSSNVFYILCRMAYLGIGQCFFIDKLNIEIKINTHLKPNLEKVFLALKKL